MDRKAIDTAAVYRTVADTLPTEGRDFTLDTVTNADGSQKLVITPKSAIGNAWIPHLQRALDATMKGDGVKTELSGTANAEVVTVASLRAKVESEAATALAKQVEATKKDIAAKTAELGKLKQQTPPAGAIDIRNAAGALKASERYAAKLARLAKRVPAVRAKIDADAKAAALADEKKGQSWALDLNAPLETKFEQEDAYEKLWQKEQDVLHIAQREIDIEALHDNAVALAKQYSVQKGA